MSSRKEHFSLRADEAPAAPGRYVDPSALEPLRLVPGLDFRPILGQNCIVNFVSYEPHSEAPLHVHAEEQIVLVLDGELEFDLDGETRRMREGEVAVVPPWVPHAARTHEGTCRQIDVFAPPRATLLDHAHRLLQHGETLDD